MSTDLKSPLSVEAQLWSIAEVAVFLGISTRTIRRLVDLREFPRPLKLGAAMRFDVSEVKGYLSRKLETRK